MTHFPPKAARPFGQYSTPKYFLAPQQEPYPPPIWSLPPAEREQILETTTSVWRSRPNHESGEPPLYYALAGGWLNIGRLFHITGARLLYWVRFLNIPIAAVVVWFGYVAARTIFQDRDLPQLTPPLLLAVWPQSALYSIASDALSPLC